MLRSLVEFSGEERGGGEEGWFGGGELFFWGGWVKEGDRVKFSLPFFCLVGLDFQRKHTVELIFQTC